MSSIITVSLHQMNLRSMRCVVSERTPVTLHHCHGASMRELMPRFPPSGAGRKNNPFFQIPLHFDYHVGRFGIDSGMGVVTWEKEFGTQLDWLRYVSTVLGLYDIFEQADLWQRNNSKSIGIQAGMQAGGEE